MALAGRLAATEPTQSAKCFAAGASDAESAELAHLHASPAG